MTPTTRRLSACCGLAALALTHPAMAGWPTGAAPTVIAHRFVDDDAPPGGDGLSWATAFQTIQGALDSAAAVPADPNIDNDTVQIRIGAGTYVPQVRLDPADPRTATFHITGRAVEIAGGFAGYGAPTPDAIDPSAYPTILTGDLTGDDQPGFVNRADNAYHIVSQGIGSSSCYLSGLTLRAGNATDIQPDHFIASIPNGGAVLTRGLSAIDCVFTENEAERGGAIGDDIFASRVSATDCVFLANRATAEGGAIRLRQVDSFNNLRLTSCRFLGNTAPIGGALAWDLSGTANDAYVIGCDFSGNTAEGDTSGATAGGAISGPTGTLAACSLSGNSCPTGSGGAISSPSFGGWRIANCAFGSNPGQDGSAPLSQLNGDLFDVRSSVMADLAEGGSIMFFGPNGNITASIAAEPMFVEPLGPDGFAGTLDDDLRPVAGSPVIDAGSSSFVALGTPIPTDTTIGGEARVVDDPTRPNLASTSAVGYFGPIDIGAYEYQADCDADGTLDSVQIADDPSLDENRNGILDFCDSRPRCPGDANADGAVDVDDLNAVLSAWMTSVPTPGLGGDVSGDGFVGMDDLNAVLGSWLSECP